MNNLIQKFQEYHHEYIGKIIGQSFNNALESYGLETIIEYTIEEKRQQVLNELLDASASLKYV
jgi:hypothetical protein